MVQPATSRRLLPLALLAVALGACKGPAEGGSGPALFSRWSASQAPLPEPQDVPAPPAPVVTTDDGFDWVRLSSGEWLKGEILVFDREVLQFDSDELDELEFDWEDVVEVRSPHEFTLVLDDRREVTGVFRMLDDEIFVTDAEGTRTFPRKSVFRMVPGETSELDHWSGKLSIGLTARSGNTNQTDFTTALTMLRRTARSRLPLSFDSAYGELEGEPNTNNQRLRGNYDWYLGSRLYVTPLGFELYRDTFQNLELRASPYTGLGYTLIDAGPLEWDVNVGLGYRYTRYDSVEPGEDDSDGTGAAIVGTVLSWDPTGSVDVDFDYSAQIGLEDASDTNQGATLELSVDLWWDLDLDVRLRWDRVGQPQPDDNGVLPKKDDYRLTVGLTWEF
jgi:putative salt-induced outer membrane protein YdiY